MNFKKIFSLALVGLILLIPLLVQAEEETSSEICSYSILLFDVYIIEHGPITVPRYDDHILIYADKVNFNQEKDGLILENPRFRIYSRRSLDIKKLIGPVTFACKDTIEFSLEPPFSPEEVKWWYEEHQTSWQMVIISANKKDGSSEWQKFYGRSAETGKFEVKESYPKKK